MSGGAFTKTCRCIHAARVAIGFYRRVPHRSVGTYCCLPSRRCRLLFPPFRIVPVFTHVGLRSAGPPVCGLLPVLLEHPSFRTVWTNHITAFLLAPALCLTPFHYVLILPHILERDATGFLLHRPNNRPCQNKNPISNGTPDRRVVCTARPCRWRPPHLPYLP